MKRSLAEYFSVEGRVGVITGAGGGLCGEMARSLAALGARIAVLDLNADNARKGAGGNPPVRRAGGGLSLQRAGPGQLAEVEAAIAPALGRAGFPDERCRRQRPAGQHHVEILERAELAAGPAFSTSSRRGSKPPSP